ALGREEWLTEGGGARALGRLPKPPGPTRVEMVSGLPLAAANARAAECAEASAGIVRTSRRAPDLSAVPDCGLARG
ncbi:MAG: hypothetical protein JJU00_01890, partial [Opitutales bacterium]|nr:hypothetical protein [Opitutales bacterium]